MSDACNDFHSLRVTDRSITLASCDNDIIHVLDDPGALKETHGGPGEAAGKFGGPIICSVESDDRMLVADDYNNRFQVYHDGKWRVLSMQPQPSERQDAVVTQHALYVIDCGKLIMYRFQ